MASKWKSSVSISHAAAKDSHSLKEQKQSSPTLLRTISTQNLSSCRKYQRLYYTSRWYPVHRIHASMNESENQKSISTGDWDFRTPFATISSFSFDPKTSTEVKKKKKKTSWIERMLGIRSKWTVEQQQNDGGGSEVDGGGNEDEENPSFNRLTFLRWLTHVSWTDTKRFSQLAFLSNMAYIVPEIKPEDLRRHYSLDLITSSVEKNAQAEAIASELNQDSFSIPVTNSEASKPYPESCVPRKCRHHRHSSITYEIAAYVQSCCIKGLTSMGLMELTDKEDEAILCDQDYTFQEEVDSSSSPEIYNAERAAYMASSTMTAVAVAGQKEKQEAARVLQPVHSSPFDWFVCDETSITTRYFVIQGLDSLASWQAYLLFEPTMFEGTDVLVHRGIYEAAKDIYDQLTPEIIAHMNKHGERAKVQFTGHSLGGSLCVIIMLMLLTRKVVNPSALRPVVTFGSPFVFCGAQMILDEFGLDDTHIHCVIMHRDIVPRAFSCNLPDNFVQLLKRLNDTFQSHTYLNKDKTLYTPMGKIFILQPRESSSPAHPFLPPGSALYVLETSGGGSTKSTALYAFLNSPHPIETLILPDSYGSNGTILRDHDSSNYLKAENEVIRQHPKMTFQVARKPENVVWPLLTLQSPHNWNQDHD